ncbi:MAG: TrmB family transcriptional regulator [Candidatus Thorarchaeota archaeon]|nr:TrmB family transcriptional regulator [Candidatus Thorarchaeota archaeon]
MTQDGLSGLFKKEFNKPSDLLCCAFGLRSSEIDTYFALLSGEKTVEELTAVVRRDRSTVQRILTQLYSKGLVERETRYFERGGHYYVYRGVSTERVRKEILDQLEQWYRNTRTFLLKSWPGSSQPAREMTT